MSKIATLIANPQNPVLAASLVEDVATAISCRNVFWLAEGIACDLVLPDATLAFEQPIRIALKNLPVDVVIQNQDARRKKALIADMDSTMIEQECIDELAAEIGLKEQVSEITARAMNGEIPFEPALRERVELLKGLPVVMINQVIENRITLMPGGRELVATMNANGAFTWLVSGGFSHFTNKVSTDLGFHDNRANRLIEKDGKLTGEVLEPILGRKAKVEALKHFAKQQNLQPSDFLAVGDGANDLDMLGIAGSGVALHAKPAVAAAADIRIDHGDLTALLYLQGYRKIEFVT